MDPKPWRTGHPDSRQVWNRIPDDVRERIVDLALNVSELSPRELATRFTGTHTGEFLGNQPTGKRVDYQSYELYRIADRKIAEEWICADMLTILTQIGAFPARHLLFMWLAGYRVWFAAGLGLLAGVISTLVLSFIAP
ncbi:hypothetical protein CSIRO_0013 [Bradyrhizobiaceae bacterium SG-6C]|nr:hypothetical protein CSIRO_0013 [Bradyrhizobiaceae bacterium SG-6C]